MAITIPKYQSLFFKSLEDRTISVGNNLITNGKFNTNLSGWIADDYIWQAGVAAYNWTYAVYNGSVKQENIDLLANKRYKVSFKYRATKKFDIVFRLKSMVTPAVDAMEEQVFRANQDGNWHLVEYFVNMKVNATQYLLLGSRGFPDDLGVNPLDGIEFDDASIYEQKNITTCGDCDTIIMDSNKPIEFQIKGKREIGSNLIINSDFSNNTIIVDERKFDTDNDTWTAVLNFEWSSGAMCHIPANSSSNLGSIGKIYTGLTKGTEILVDALINYTNSAIVNNRKFTLLVVDAPSTILFEKHFYVDTVDTVTETISEYTIIKNANTHSVNIGHDGGDTGDFNLCVNEIKVTQIITGFIYSNFKLNITTNQLEYKYLENPIQGTIEKTLSLVSGKNYRFRYNFQTSDNFSATINVRNSSNTIVYTETKPFLKKSGIFITDSFEYLCSANDTYKLELIFTPDNEDDELIIDNISCFEYRIDELVLQAKDCQGNLTTLPHTQIPYGENVLIQINNSDFPTNTPFQIIINDSQTTALGLQHFSENIQLIDFNNTHQCNVDSYVKLNWSDTCYFKDIDYKNLPFENEFYIRGFIIRKPLDKRERIQTTNPDGSLKTIFNHSYAKSELRIGPYGKDVHAILERAIEHSVFKIDDAIYYLDEGSSYTISAIGNGNFMARIELVESGSEVVKTACCC